jgi:5-methylcytosine-specific restriction endonuclease McrA
MKSIITNKELEEVYQIMSETLPHRCTGCGSYQQLTNSHLIPRSRSKSTITDINNIRYHCYPCHKKWESGIVAHEMTDFQRNMEYIKSIDEAYFHIREQKLDKNSAFFLGDYQVK